MDKVDGHSINKVIIRITKRRQASFPSDIPSKEREEMAKFLSRMASGAGCNFWGLYPFFTPSNSHCTLGGVTGGAAVWGLSKTPKGTLSCDESSLCHICHTLCTWSLPDWMSKSSEPRRCDRWAVSSPSPDPLRLVWFGLLGAYRSCPNVPNEVWGEKVASPNIRSEGCILAA